MRISRATEESTSVERQREIIETWAKQNDCEIVGWAEDEDVSGSVRPFDAPGLGPWLSDRAPDWDVLCAWKLDRLGRNAIHLSELFGWCQDHGKTVVSCSESIDLGTPVGRLIANVIAFLAEGELEAIRERTKASRAKLRELGRWGGGSPPYGYRPVPREGGGWLLEKDDEAAKVIQRIVRELLDGASMNSIATALTAEGVPTPTDQHRLNRGLELKGRKWQVTPIRQILRGRSLLGQLHYDGQAVRDDDGMPVQLADPLVTVDEWERVQAVLDGNSNARKDARRAPTALLSGLAFCGTCGKVLHSESNTSRRNSTGERRTYRYYSCADRCSPMLRAEELDMLAEEEFLRQLGDREVRERVWVPGDSNQEALAEAVRAVDELSAAAGRATSATMRQRLQRQLDALDSRIAELEAQPAREAHWEWVATGGTYGDAWEAAADEPEARRALLQRSGITFEARVIGGRGSKAREFHVRIPEGVWTEPVLTDQQQAIRDALADPDVRGVDTVSDGGIRTYTE